MSDNKDLLQRLQDSKEALARLERGESPSAAELASSPQLDFWYLTERGLVLALGGIVTGHPNQADGAHVLTSAPLRSDERPVGTGVVRTCTTRWSPYH